MNSAPSSFGNHHGTVADREAIEQLLENYTQSVTNGDEKRFESLLLQPDIPFSSTRGLPGPDESITTVDTRNYAAFNAVIFASGSRFHQQFHNVKIEQVGALAQASLDYVTTEDATGSVSYGWKVIHLLKVSGNWKIASEFYTGYPLA